MICVAKTCLLNRVHVLFDLFDPGLDSVNQYRKIGSTLTNCESRHLRG